MNKVEKSARKSAYGNLDEMLIYCADLVQQTGDACTFERLVYECFTRFPEQFGMISYPQWPDNDRINKAWLRCRTDRGWMVGTRLEGFQVTPIGKRIAADVERRIKLVQPREVRSSRPRNRADVVVRQIRTDEFFTRYRADPQSFELTEMELRRLAGCTMESPSRVVRQNIAFYRTSCDETGDTEAAAFLRKCDDEWKRLFPRE